MVRIAPLALVAALAAGCGIADDGPSGRGFALSWKLVDAAAPDPLAAPALACSDAGVDTILFDGLDDGNRRHRVAFTCDTLEGVTPPLPVGRYQVLLEARTTDGTPRSQITFAADNYDDAAADLGLTVFQIIK